MSKEFLDEEGLGPLERGRGRYHQKDYSGALAAFDEAVEISSGNLLLTALDHRAAAFEKLDKLQAALRDSKRMIDLKPDLSRGYLRCAKVLQLKGETGLALKIYERGLNKVKIGTDNDRTKLQSMYNKLRQAQDPGKSLDPLDFLPIELAQIVIESLGMRDRIACLAVTKSWKRLLESSHKLWTTFDTRNILKPVSLTALKLHLRRSNYTLDKAVISMKAKFDVAKMQYLTRTCTKLKYLEICGSGFIGETLTAALPLAKSLETIVVGKNCEISRPVVQTVLEICRQTLVEAVFLRVVDNRWRLDYGNWPHLQSLRTLTLQCPDTIKLDLHRLPDGIPNIKSLVLTDWNCITMAPVDLSNLKDLESLDISKSLFSRMPILPVGLRHLSLSRFPEWPRVHPEVYDLPLLESFDCSGTFIPPTGVKAITLKSIESGNLKTLYMGWPLEESVPVELEYPASNSVEKLSLALLTIPERRILEIIKLYPNLQKLDVSATRITGVAVKQFVAMGIKLLKLNECREVSPDAVDYARGKGVDVEFNFPSRSGRVAFFGASYTAAF